MRLITRPIRFCRRHHRLFKLSLLESAFVLACAHAQAQTSANTSAGSVFTATAATASTSYLDIEGSNAGTFANFGVIDFSPSAFSLSGQTVSGLQNNTLTLTLTESNAGFSVNGPFEIYLTTNNTASIAAGASGSTLRYNTTPAGLAQNGVDPALGTVGATSGNVLYDLGTENYVNNGTGAANYQTDTFTLTLSNAAASAFATELNSTAGAPVRLVLAAASASTYATYTGAVNTFKHTDGTSERPLLAFTPTYSTAGSLYWQTGSGTWSATSGTNFDPSAGGTADTAWNNDGAHVADFATNAGSTVSVDNGIQAAGIRFDVTGYTLNPLATGNVLTLTGVSPSIQVSNASDTATVNVKLGGTAGLSKTGAGTLILGGQNTYTGTTTISGGTLQISGGQNLGVAQQPVALNSGTLHTLGTMSLNRAFSGSGGIQVDSGGTLSIGGVVNMANLMLPGAGTLALTNSDGSLANSASNAITGTVTFATAGATLTTADLSKSGAVNGNGIILLGGVSAAQATGAVTLAANAQLTNNGTVTVSVPTAGATLNLPGGLAGAAVVAKTGAGTLVLGGDNSGLTGTGTTLTSFRQGTASANPVSGGVISIAAGNPNPGAALGTAEFQANGGTVSNDSGSAITLTISDISLGAQDATGTPGGLVLAGSAGITVNGPISLYNSTTAPYQHTITVTTPTVITGILSAAAATATKSLGLTLRGSSTLTLNAASPGTMTEPVTIATSGAGSGVIAMAEGTFAANSAVIINAGAALTISTGVVTGTTNAINDAALLTINGATGTGFGKLVLTLGAGVKETVGGLYLQSADGTLLAGYQAPGTYGATGSGAQYIDNTLFSGLGVINNLATVPEPSTWATALVGGGLLGLAAARGRRRRGRQA